MKAKILSGAAIAAVVVLFAAACSSGSDDGGVGGSAATTAAVQATAASAASDASVAADAVPEAAVEAISAVVPFAAGNGTGTVAISGESSPVAVWFANLPGETALDLRDADIGDAGSVVEELLNFWFFSDDDSGDTPPLIYESDSSEITDSVGTRYVVEAEGLPPVPVAETTTTTSSTTATSSTVTSSVPEISEAPSTATSSTTTTTSSTTTTTTAAVAESPAVLLVQVLNGSGVAGAAGRMTDKLSEAGYVVLSPENAPQRYSSSAVYYQEGWQDKAEEILQAADIEEIDAPSAMPQQFISENAAVIVLLGTDTAPAVAREQAGLRPRQRNDVQLPLPDSVPRDRYVPGLAAVNLYTEQNESNPASAGQLADIASFLKEIGDCSKYQIGTPRPDKCQERLPLSRLYKAVEELLEDLGFTPQNVCGAPPGYSFTDLLQPTREMDEEWRYYTGDAIFTTDRLIELHGGTRINPEANLDFYINQAVQTAHDMLRLPELLDQTEAPQLVLCAAWLAPSGEVPEFSNAAWYTLLTPGIQPQESLLSQGTYHVKEISRNGNIVHIIVCHPTIRERHIILYWREAGYRAELLGYSTYTGCQGTFDGETSISEDSNGAEDTIRYSFGERVFSSGDLLQFPRS